MTKLITLCAALCLLFATGSTAAARDLYFVGDDTGWAKNDNYAFEGSGGVYTFRATKDFSNEWKIFDGTWNYCFGPGSTTLAANVENAVVFNGGGNFSLAIKTGDILTLTLTGDENNPTSATLLVTREGEGGGGDDGDGDGDGDQTNPWDIRMHGQTANNGNWHDVEGIYTVSNNIISYTFTATLNNENNFGFRRMENNEQKAWWSCSSGNTNDYTLTSAGKTFASFGSAHDFVFSGNDNSTVTITFTCTTTDATPKNIVMTVSDGGGGEIVDMESRRPSAQPSGSLPRLYITTDEAVISYNLRDKDYRDGTYYLVDKDGTALLGTEDEPLPLEIKARGNYTRTGFSKKPFKIKLGKKQEMLGLSKSKHYALLAHADDNLGYLKNYVGFWLGKQIFPEDVFTPQEQPVELIINGDYRGLYFLTESIRIEETRVNIVEGQDDDSTPANASGGYLVEMDNYDDEGQIKINPDKYGNDVWITPDTPEVYSDLQQRFVTDQFTTMNNLITAKDSSLWQYLDMDMAARYYVVMEILNHWEAYHGSTYLYRDLGEGQKWMFSPIWDCGNALYGDEIDWIYKVGAFGHNGHYGNTWIKALCDFTEFTQKAKDTFLWFWGNKVGNLESDINTYVNYIAEAAKADRTRWNGAPLPSQYEDPYNAYSLTNPTAVYDNSDMNSKRNTAWENLKKKIDWLKNQWGTPYTGSPEPAWDETPAAPLPDYATVPTPKDHNLNTDEVYVYLYDEAGWNATPSIYVYTNNGSITNGAFGTVYMEEMDSELYYDAWHGLYAYKVPANLVNGQVMFYVNGYTRYPADQQPGLELNGTTHIFNNKTNQWIEVLPNAQIPVSGNLPVLYISEVSDLDALANKQETTANLTWDTNGCDDALEIAGAVAIKTFKGHGSSSWTDWNKKPYKIKADAKVTFFNDGTAESKHWLLLPWCADTELTYLRNVVGHELSRQMGFPWTPQEQPVELVIEGEYQGLYFLVESIRPSENRVNVMDIDDTDKTSMPAHWHNWIVELDQTSDASDHTATVGSTELKFTADSPELAEDMTSAKFLLPNSENPELTNAEQYTADFQADMQAMTDELKAATSDIYSGGWMNHIEPKSLARFFVLNELMDDPNAFYTAFYLWKAELDANGATTDESRWQAGPVWDFSGAFESRGSKNALTHEYSAYLGHEIPLAAELWENRWFRNQVVIEFKEFFTGETPVPGSLSAPRRANLAEDKMSAIETALTTAAAKIDGALEADNTQWSGSEGAYTGTGTATATDNVATVMQYLRNNYTYLNTLLTTDIMTGVEGVESAAPAVVEYFDTQGRRVLNPERGGIYVVRQGSRAALQIVR